MNLEDIPEGMRDEYHADCDVCGMKTTFLSSYNDTPEYEHDLWIQCSCGNYIHFVIPIN